MDILLMGFCLPLTQEKYARIVVYKFFRTKTQRLFFISVLRTSRLPWSLDPLGSRLDNFRLQQVGNFFLFLFLFLLQRSDSMTGLILITKDVRIECFAKTTAVTTRTRCKQPVVGSNVDTILVDTFIIQTFVSLNCQKQWQRAIKGQTR